MSLFLAIYSKTNTQWHIYTYVIMCIDWIEYIGDFAVKWCIQKGNQSNLFATKRVKHMLKLDGTRRKASEICLRYPLDIYSHTFSR